MVAMDFFRRPQLVGKVLKHLDAGALRGSLRRLDPDGFSAVPYFAGVSTGQTLNISLDGTPYVATLTGATPNYQSILNDINTALGVNGEATDEDGTIGIKTFTPGGFVQVTGGSASVALGFDVTKQKFRSSAGDLFSTPERRIGNPYGAAFPARGENFTIDAVNRAMGRVAANLDVLFSEHMRQDARMVKIDAASTSISSPAAGTSIITLPAATRVFTGKGILPSTPTAEALAPFVQLIDPVTGLPPATCRVIDIVRGSVVGSPPYADAPNYAGVGSVVNVDLTKFSGSITSITNGRVVKVTGASFTTNGTKVGDWVNITGATNITPWSNNGYRWVIEEIIDNEHVALRPMSMSEAAQAGLSGNTEEQPILDLNSDIAGVEVYGTIEIKTGTYTDAVRLVVQPQIPANATYDVWVTQPLGIREANSGTGAEFPHVADVVSQRDPLPNGLISGFNITGSSSSRTIGEGYIRMHGKILRIPAASYTPAGLGAGTHFVYFDESDGRIKTVLTTLPTARVSYDPTGVSANPVIRPIARFVSNGATFSGPVGITEKLTRYATAPVERITLGEGGDFQDLFGLQKYVNAVAAEFGETSNLMGTYPHFEVILLNNIATGDDIEFRCPSITIRGANPLVRLNVSTSPFLTFYNCYFLKIQDLIFEGAGDIWIRDAQDVATEGAEVYLSRVRSASGSDFNNVIQGVNGARLRKLVIEDCALNITNTISSANDVSGNLQDIYVARSRLVYTGDGSSTMMFNDEGGVGNDWMGSSITLRDNFFDGWFTTDLAGTLISNDGGPGSARFLAEGNIFTFGTFPLNSKASLWDVDTPKTVFKHNVFTNSIPRAVIVPDSSVDSEVSNNVLIVAPHAVTNGTEAIIARRVHHNSITSLAPSSGSRGMVASVIHSAIGNRVSGDAIIGLASQDAVGAGISNVLFQGNYVSLTTGAQTGIRCHAIRARGSKNRVFGNQVSMTTTGGYTLDAAAIGADSSETQIADNHITAAGCFGIGANNASADGIIANNHLFNTTDISVASSAAIKLRQRWIIEGNKISGNLAGYVAIRTSAVSASLFLSTNYIFVPSAFDFTLVPAELMVNDCFFEGDVNLGSTVSASFSGNTLEGDFTSARAGVVSRNVFRNNVTIPLRGVGESLIVSDNEFTGGGTLTTTEDKGFLKFVGNSIQGAFSVTRTFVGSGHVAFVGNDINGALTVTPAAGGEPTIDVLESNRLQLSGTPTLSKASVIGNTFVSTTGLTLSNGSFVGNKINSSSLSFINETISSNVWGSTTPGTISLTGDNISSNNWYEASSWTVGDTLRSSCDFFPASFSGTGFSAAEIFFVQSLFTVTTFVCVSGANYRFQQVSATNIDVAAANVIISESELNNITSTTWNTGGRLFIQGCRTGGIVDIAPAVSSVKTGSVVAIRDCQFDEIIVEGAETFLVSDCYVLSATGDGITASYITDFEVHSSRIDVANSGVVASSNVANARLFDVVADEGNDGFVLQGVTVAIIMRDCVGVVVADDCTADIDIDGCSGFGLSASNGGPRNRASITNCHGPSLTVGGISVGASQSVVVEGFIGKFVAVEYDSGALEVAVRDCKLQTSRAASSTYAISVEGSANTALLGRLDISNNRIELDNIGGTGDIPTQGIKIGDQALSDANAHKIKHLKVSNNIVVASRVPSSVTYLADSLVYAIRAYSKIHSGIVNGNEIDVPRPGTAYTGGGFVRWKFFIGLRDDGLFNTNVVFAGNHFMKTTWTHAATPAVNSHEDASQSYDTGNTAVDPVSATGADDIYDGGFRAFQYVDQVAQIPSGDMT